MGDRNLKHKCKLCDRHVVCVFAFRDPRYCCVCGNAERSWFINKAVIGRNTQWIKTEECSQMWIILRLYRLKINQNKIHPATFTAVDTCHRISYIRYTIHGQKDITLPFRVHIAHLCKEPIRRFYYGGLKI